MKKALWITLLILACFSSFAQKIRFSDSTNQWTWLFCSIDGGQPIWLYSYLSFENYSGTVIINSHEYLGLGSSLIREDTIANKVFIRYYNTSTSTLDTVDEVLYDYNLSVGDTIKHYVSDYFSTSWVTSIDSTLINGIWYKVWHFSGNLVTPGYFIGGFAYNVIEGIGCTNGLTYPYNPAPPFEASDQLVCFQNMGDSPPLSNPVTSWGVAIIVYFDDSASCAMHPLDISKLNNKNKITSIFPNPIDRTSKIVLPDKGSGTLAVFNDLGQMIFCSTFEHKAELLIGDKINVPGIYFYRITDNEGARQYSGKFVFQ